MTDARIKISTTIKADLQTAWKCYTDPASIMKWNFASPEWHCPSAQNSLEPGGRFSWRMEARDGSMGFDFAGHYDQIADLKLIQMHLDDGRCIVIRFRAEGEWVHIEQEFDPDKMDIDLQRQGWQAILNNYKAHTEGQSKKA